MRQLLIGVAAAASVAVTGPLWAQVPPPPAQWAAAYPAPVPGQVPPPAPRQWPPAAYFVQRYPFPGVSPEQAYNDGIINRWQLEQYEGPTPQALQGPNPNGSKGSQGDRGM